MISIIVPVYNVEKYIRRCVSTLIEQKYSDIEILLIDDGSTDSSGAICDELALIDKRIRVIHKDNGGLSDARNMGIENARGEYIGFVDSDDYIHASMYEVLWENIEKEKADIAYCNFYWIDETETVLEDLVGSKVQVFEGADILGQIYKLNLPTVIAWNKLYRRELFDSIRYPKGKVHEDEAIIHRLLYICKKIVYIDEKLYYYVKRKGSITDSINEGRLRDAISAFEGRRLFFRSKGLDNLENSTVEFTVNYLTSIYSLYLKGESNSNVLIVNILQNEMKNLVQCKYDIKKIFKSRRKSIETSLFAYNLRGYKIFLRLLSVYNKIKNILKIRNLVYLVRKDF